MNRRGFPGALPFLLPAASLVAADSKPRDLEYRGYRVFWVDYLAAQDADRLVGRWYAWPLDAAKRMATEKNLFIVALTTGLVHTYNPGYTFNLSQNPERKLINHYSNEADREEVKRLTFDSLIKFIDDLRTPKVRIETSGNISTSELWGRQDFKSIEGLPEYETGVRDFIQNGIARTK